MVSVKNEDIQRIIDLVKSNDIEELEIQDGKTVVRVRAMSQTFSVETGAKIQTQSTTNPPLTESHEIGTPVTAPLVGTVYLSPSPDQKPFVQVGDTVKKGQTLCLIEAMKTFNHIKSPHDGKVTKACIKNGQTVEFEQDLFLLSDQ